MPRPKGPTLTFTDLAPRVLQAAQTRGSLTRAFVKQRYGKRGLACVDRLVAVGRLSLSPFDQRYRVPPMPIEKDWLD